MNRKRLLLTVLVGLFALSVIYAFWAMPRQEKAPPRTVSNLAAKGSPAVKPGQPSGERLNLGLLAELPQPFPGAGRDIFRFYGGQPAPVEVPAVAALPEPVEEAPPPPPPPPPTPEQILREKVAGFTFLGFLDKGGVKTVFLSSAGELYLVKAGDVFGRDRSLQAKEVNDRELVVGSVNGPETVRVNLVENTALMPAAFSSGGGGERVVPRIAPGFRPGATGVPARRNLLMQRAAELRRAPASEEEVIEEVPQEEVQPPDDGVDQEEPPNEEAPTTEGNGNAN